MAVYTPLPCGHTVIHGAREPAPNCKQCALAPASASIPADVEREEAAAVAIAQILGIDLHEQCGAGNDNDGMCESGTCPGAMTEDHDTDEHRERIYRMARAALAARPSTGGAMDGEGRNDG